MHIPKSICTRFSKLPNTETQHTHIALNPTLMQTTKQIHIKYECGYPGLFNLNDHTNKKKCMIKKKNTTPTQFRHWSIKFTI